MTRLYSLLLSALLCITTLAARAQVDFIDITLNSGSRVSYPIASVESVSFHTEAAPGDGSYEHPYSVAEALVAYLSQTAAQQVWVKGVIVGSVQGSYYSDATLALEGSPASNLLLADTRWETASGRCLPLQLPTGAVRKALNLQDNPDNFHHELLVYATLDKYFGVAGLKSPSQYELGPLASDIVQGSAQHPGRMEVPALVSGDEFVVHQAFVTDQTTQRVPNFYVSYSPALHHSHWVAFRFDDKTRPKNTTRSEGSSYPQDPDCASSLPTTAFAGTGYDHGHLCASADRLYSSKANEQTFYMTNMSPQLPQFNRTYWNYYETYVQTIGRDEAFADTLYVVKGGTIADGQVERQLSCNGIQVPVPKYYFMALLKVKDQQYSAMAFWMDHKEYDTVKDKNAELAAYAVSIDELERLTGFDFFPCLPAATEQSVEGQLRLTDWNLPEIQR
ncbi:MAG: DNA/RNA non-specific endonuclease [Bacteroidaceae bacterium]|nr:DNA/RNA non-specific endonuclease [Bacteroidaceae bacterium]